MSWFWTLGATLVAEFPVVAKDTLGASGEVVSLFLTMFSFGIGVGSLLCARVLHGEATARYVPVTLLGISLFTWDFATASASAQGLVSVADIIASPHGWRILMDLVLLSACGGFYSVPLYALIQQRAEPALAGAHHRRQQRGQRRLHGGRCGGRRSAGCHGYWSAAHPDRDGAGQSGGRPVEPAIPATIRHPAGGARLRAGCSTASR